MLLEGRKRWGKHISVGVERNGMTSNPVGLRKKPRIFAAQSSTGRAASGTEEGHAGNLRAYHHKSARGIKKKEKERKRKKTENQRGNSPFHPAEWKRRSLSVIAIKRLESINIMRGKDERRKEKKTCQNRRKLRERLVGKGKCVAHHSLHAMEWNWKKKRKTHR